MSKFIIDLRSSFWFIPALIASAAAVLALGAIELDDRVGHEALARFPRIFGAGAEGTRQLLSAIASSTITVAGVVFSITVVALSLTAAQYSPRVLRSFMRDRANQVVLGIFLGVYVYCLLVLRTIRGGEHEFVPGIAAIGAIGLALVGVAFLIYFIHHIATSIQVSEIAARISAETIGAIERGLDGRDHDAASGEGHERLDLMPWKPLPATATGYIQSIDHDRLAGYARSVDAVVSMQRAAGDFIVRGETLALVSGAPVDESATNSVNGACAINTYRDITQDAAFGVQQLVDIALKALSPGVNDTATARTCLDYLTSVLLELVKHEINETIYVRDGDGRLRVIARARSIEYFIAATFEAIRRYSTTNVDMLLHALKALERVGACATPACRAAVSREVEAVHEALASAQYVSGDKRQLTAAIASAAAALSANTDGRDKGVRDYGSGS